MESSLTAPPPSFSLSSSSSNEQSISPAASGGSPPMPLSQWLMSGTSPPQQSLPYGSGGPLSDITPTSSGLPHIPQLGPSIYDMCPPDWLPVRQYCILASRATAGDLQLLSDDWKRYILQHTDYSTFTVHHHKALEALLCTQIFAGMPRCIESLYTAYNTELQYIYQPIERYRKKLNDGMKLTPKQQRDFQRLNRIKELIQRDQLDDVRYGWATEATNIGASKPYTPLAPSSTIEDQSCGCGCKSCACKRDFVNDPHSTPIRNKRGDATLTAIYRHTYDSLARSMNQYHPTLWSSIRQHIYGFLLARTILSIQEIECVAVSCLAGMNVPRQLHSHLRGCKFNGVSYELLCSIYHDLRLVHTPQQIDSAIRLLNKVYHVTPTTDEDEDEEDGAEEQYSEVNELKKVKELEEREDVGNVDKKFTIEDASGKYGLGITPFMKSALPLDSIGNTPLPATNSSPRPYPPIQPEARLQRQRQNEQMPVLDDDESGENQEARQIGLSTIARLTNMMKEREQQIADMEAQQPAANRQAQGEQSQNGNGNGNGTWKVNAAGNKSMRHASDDSAAASYTSISSKL